MSAANLGASQSWLRALERLAAASARPDGILAVVIEERAIAQPHAPALLSQQGTLSYAELAGQSNRYARWTLAQGIKPGEVVCLLIANSPDYVAAWLGITRVGAVAALLNTNLLGATLVHCVALCGRATLLPIRLSPGNWRQSRKRLGRMLSAGYKTPPSFQ